LKKVIISFILIILAILGSNSAYSNNDTVHIIHISGMINEGVYTLVRRGINKAIENNARYIVVEIDTFGGLVDSAVKIRDALLDSPITTVAYVKNRAWSAGALIAIACEKIAFTEAGSMGAAEPRPTDEKTVSALRAEFSATAERRKRDPKIAEAMVDQSIEIEGLKPKGKLLTLTASQAKKYKYADLIANSYDELWNELKIKNPRVMEEYLNWSERLSQITADPTYSFLFLLVGMILLLAEFQVPGFGILGALGITSIALTFIGNYLAGLAGIESILLLIGGLILLFIELHTPGFGIPGIAGIISLFTSLYMVLGGGINATRSIAMAGILILGVIILFITYLPKSFAWKRLALKEAEKTETGYTAVTVEENLVGREGIAVTLLRPAGVVEIDNKKYDCLTEGEYIPAGTKVTVTKVIGNRIFVRKID